MILNIKKIKMIIKVKLKDFKIDLNLKMNLDLNVFWMKDKLKNCHLLVHENSNIFTFIQ
jgi:hypothetical protein